MSAPLAFLALYVALQLLAGVVISRRIRTRDDYLLAGRNLGPLLASASFFATWFGAEACVGVASEVYQHGLDAISGDPFGYGLCLLLFGALVAGPLWAHKLTTLADLFRARFSRGVERLVALMLVPGSLLWASAQIRAFGQVLSVTSELSEEAAIACAAVVAVTYTTFGGLLADAYADLVQGGILIACLVGLLVAVVMGTGGLPETYALLSSPALEAATAAPVVSSPWTTLNDWAVPILGSLFAQELVARASASRSQRVARRSAMIAACVYVVVGCIPVLLGAIAHRTLEGVHPEQVLATLANKHLPNIGYILFSGALVSAILSTVDSTLLVCGSLISNNLLAVVSKQATEARKIEIARASVLAFGLIAFVLALSADSVHSLVHEASAFGSAGICVAGIFGLFSRKGGRFSAYTALVLGTGTWIWAAYVAQLEAAFLCSLGAALLGYVICAWFEEASSTLTQTVADPEST